MNPSAIIDALLECELDHQGSLMDVLGGVKGSKDNSRLPSIVRGMYTNNKQLVAIAQLCLAVLEADGHEAFKNLVNDFINWFDNGFVVFEKYLLFFPAELDPENRLYLKPILHCGCYLAFIDAAVAKLRNPFVVDKLNESKVRLQALLDAHAALADAHKMNNITFDNIQSFAGLNVSCFFTTDQIVARTGKASVYMGQTKVELLLLNLDRKSSRKYNSLAILKVPQAAGARSVIYPPFRVNELFMAISNNCINFSAVSLCEESPIQQRFSITGSETVVSEWYNKLRKIFPTEEKLLTSLEVQLVGLGINTVSDSSEDDTPNLVCESEVSTPSPRITRTSEDLSSSEIMKKEFSNNGISPNDDVGKLLNVVTEPEQPKSIRAEYDYADEAGSSMESISLSDDVADCFEMVPPKPIMMNKDAGVSLPELNAPPAQTTVYRNAAGSAIDLTNFGKNYNPVFESVEDLSIPKQKRKSLFGFLKKNKSKTSLEPVVEKKQQKQKGKSKSKDELPQPPTLAAPLPPPALQAIPRVESPVQSLLEKSRKETEEIHKKRPELAIQVPKIGEAVSGSQPLSATSSTFNRTLPLPFALPSSTSTYFFKPYLNNSSASLANGSSSSLVAQEPQEALTIPQDLKDIINSDDTIDFYMSSTSPKSLKVSKWKPKCGKWELLTANDSVFVKIVANYEMHKSWLLVFKEDYDEEYDEIVDVPLLVLNLDKTTNVRQSSALDIEINAYDSITNEKMLIMARCYSNTLITALQNNLKNILEVMTTKPTLKHSLNFDSDNTIASSMMSKPSASSTLTSIYTTLERPSPASVRAPTTERDEVVANTGGERVLLDRMTIKLHKQMESYEQIHQISSWKSIAMYTLSVCHSLDSVDEGYYHFEFDTKEELKNKELTSLTWSFKEEDIFNRVEKIGKAGLLVKAKNNEIYMLECKGKKELKRLVALF